MKNLHNLAVLLFGLAILLIGGMGIDLAHSRSGFGMLLMALGGVFLVISRSAVERMESRTFLVVSTILASGFFVWRALEGGPVAVAVADVALVAVILGFYLACVAGGEALLKVVVVCLGLTSLANAAVVVAQLTSDSQFFLWREPYGTKPVATGIFGHYNYMAAYLNASVFLFFALIFYFRTWWLRGLCLIVVLLSIGCVLASGSRGGWFGFVAGFGVMVVAGLSAMKARKHPGFGLAAVVSLVTLVAVVVTAVPVVQELTNRRAGVEGLTEGGESKNAQIHDGGRMYFQQLAFEMFQDAPLIGNGPRSFSYLALEYWDPEEHSNWNANPVFAHNEFLQTMSDYGAIGFVFVIVIVFGHGVSGLIFMLLNGDTRPRWLIPLKMGALAGLAAMGAQSFFSFIVHIPACAMMAGILLGLLAVEGRVKSSGGSAVAIVVPIVLVLVSGVLGYFGARFSKSFLQFEKGKSLVENASAHQEIIEALALMKGAAQTGFNPEILEGSGRLAMRMSTKSRDLNDHEAREEFARIALDHLEGVQELNPHSSVALVMIPHVHDLFGEFEKANSGYELAIEKLGVREPFLKPHLYAARSRYGQGMLALDSGQGADALTNWRKALELIQRRTEVLNAWREAPLDKAFRLEIESRIALLEGEILYREGDRVWKEARPRKPELAYALMLAAAERYQASAKILEEEPGSKWAAQWNQLEKNLDLLKRVGTKPVSLTKEQISEVINREAGLDPDAVKR